MYREPNTNAFQSRETAENRAVSTLFARSLPHNVLLVPLRWLVKGNVAKLMSDIAIRADNLAKLYRIGSSPQAKYATLRDRIATALSAPLKRFTALARAGRDEEFEHIWALKDVSFEVRCGEVVGIIGYNGAGKSTLLKILSRITEPTRGLATIHGRVGSLLEVGTGFHPELTGRENVYLNGAILGMRKTEIERKFDEIVMFAEIEKFIDTPVKFYSSGMYVRLAFAVAAHLEPDILVIDEVLAVGDARFQKKCLNKMQDVGAQGRTVLFVSHNMSTITRLCERTILLGDGHVMDDGPSYRVVSTYLSAGRGVTAQREWPEPETAPGGEVARLRAVRVRLQNGEVSEGVDIREPVAIETEYEVLQPGCELLLHHHFVNEEGLRLFTALDLDPQWRKKPRPSGYYVSTAWVPGNLLSEGTLYVHPCMNIIGKMGVEAEQFSVSEAVAFQVIDSLDGDSARGDWVGRLGGVVRPMLKWETQFKPAQ